MGSHKHLSSLTSTDYSQTYRSFINYHLLSKMNDAWPWISLHVRKAERNSHRGMKEEMSGPRWGAEKQHQEMGGNQLHPAPDTLSAPGNLKQLSGLSFPLQENMTGTTPLTAVKGPLRHDLMPLTCRKLLFTDCLACGGRTLTLAVPPSTDTHLNLQLLGGRHRAGGKWQEGCRRAPHRPLSQKGRGWKFCFHVSRTWETQNGSTERLEP